MAVLPQLIATYLDSHRRLNIPGVGAFIVKGEQPRCVIFSELLKSDDGLLRTLLAQSGLSEIEAAASVDRFVFELRRATQQVGGEFLIQGVGVLCREEGGKLSFAEEAISIEAPVAQEPIVQEPITQAPVAEPTPIKEPEQEEQKPYYPPQPKSNNTTSESTDTTRYTPERIRELYSKSQTFRENENLVKDLKYSSKRKNLNGYSYVRGESKKSGVDKVLLFGIIAACIALGAIVFGLYVANIEEIGDLFIRLGLKSIE